MTRCKNCGEPIMKFRFGGHDDGHDEWWHADPTGLDGEVVALLERAGRRLRSARSSLSRAMGEAEHAAITAHADGVPETVMAVVDKPADEDEHDHHHGHAH